MAEFVDLDCWMATPRDATAAVAWRDGGTIEYARFVARAAAWREAMAASDGARIALYFEDSAEFAAALFGAWHAGKEAVLAADVLPETLRRLGDVAHDAAGDFAADAPLRLISGQDGAQAQHATWDRLDAQRIAVHVFTSGSTGEPTLISKSLAQLCREVRALDAQFGARVGHGVVHASVTHQHMYGLAFRLLWPLASGRPFAAARVQFPEDLRNALLQTPDSILVTSPAHLKRLPEHLDWAQARVHLSALFSSAGPLPDSALPLCDRVFARRPYEIYGSSETGAVAWRERKASPEQPWQPLPELLWRVVDAHLQVQAPWLTERDWQATADHASARDGGFDLIGRSDQIVKIEEKRVSLPAIEAAVCASGLAAEARAVVLPGERARIGVVVVPNARGWDLLDHAGRRALGEQLRGALSDSIDAVALPRHWRYTSALPLNPIGKTPRSALLALFDPRRPPARVLEQTSDSATLQIDVLASSPFFDGHFADAPILPGVTQIDWAMLFARELFELPHDFARLENVKFHDWIGADTRIDLMLQRATVDGVAFRISSAVGLHASGRIRFRHRT